MKQQNPSLEENKRDESGDIGDKDKPNNAQDVPDPAPDVPAPAPDVPDPAPDVPAPAPDVPAPAPDVPAPAPDVPVASDDENPIKAKTEQKPEPESSQLKASVAEEVTTSAPEIFEPTKEQVKELSSE